ncbi:MAG: FHA domain-containing protein [Gammaproteobacteria bacterium]|nr:FHA domain-containing protein [Gammaproteobacteria bacterium]
MGHQPIVHTTSEQWGHTVPALTLVTERHRAALDQLNLAAQHQRPLTVLIGEGKFEANHVVSAFLSGLEEDATIVRLTKPYDDAIAGMREINRALGFEPKDLSLTDLDNILEMFLEFQRKHHRRTVLCIEQAHLQARWLLEHVRRLIDLEMEGRYGLMVVLSGQPKLAELIEQEPLAGARVHSSRKITLAPFSLAETTEFLRRRVEAAGSSDISELFEFDAISRIHELSGGVPDLVGTLCFKCLQIANQQKSGQVTEQLVIDASKLLWQKPAVEAKAEIPDIPDIGPMSTFREQLQISCKGQQIQIFPLRHGRFLVGRADFADICLPNKHVSRRHALIVKSATDVKILDLGSTNGTFVNGLRFTGDQQIEIGDVITIGDIRMEFSFE